MAMTTNNSIRVKPRMVRGVEVRIFKFSTEVLGAGDAPERVRKDAALTSVA
jgi:hypothetical protein